MRARGLLAALCAAVFAAAAGTHALTPLFPEIKAALGVGDEAARALSWVFTLGYSCSGIALGPLCDRLGRRRVLLPSLLAYAAASGLLLLPVGFGPFLALRAIAGIATGGIMAAVVAVTSDAVEYRRRGRAMSFVMSGSYVAVVIGMPLSNQLAHLRLTAVFGLLALVAAFALLALQTSVPADHARPAPASLLALSRAALRARGVPFALATTFFNTAAAFLVLSSLADHVVDAHGAGLDHRSLLFLVVGAAGLPGALFAGLWSDAIGKRRSVVVALLLSLVVTPVLLVPGSFAGFLCAAVPVAIVQSLRMGPFVALLAELVGDDLRGSLIGLNSVASGLGIAAGFWFGGVAYGADGLRGVVAATLACLAGALLAFAAGVKEPAVGSSG